MVTKGNWKVFKGVENVSERVPPEGCNPLWGIWIVDNNNKAVAQSNAMDDKKLKANANLIVSAVNACASVNSNNPQAVAESIKDMYEALKGASAYLSQLNVPQAGNFKVVYEMLNPVIEQALAKAERKEK